MADRITYSIDELLAAFFQTPPPQWKCDMKYIALEECRDPIANYVYSKSIQSQNNRYDKRNMQTKDGALKKQGRDPKLDGTAKESEESKSESAPNANSNDFVALQEHQVQTTEDKLQQEEKIITLNSIINDDPSPSEKVFMPQFVQEQAAPVGTLLQEPVYNLGEEQINVTPEPLYQEGEPIYHPEEQAPPIQSNFTQFGSVMAEQNQWYGFQPSYTPHQTTPPGFCFPSIIEQDQAQKVFQFDSVISNEDDDTQDVIDPIKPNHDFDEEPKYRNKGNQEKSSQQANAQGGLFSAFASDASAQVKFTSEPTIINQPSISIEACLNDDSTKPVQAAEFHARDQPHDEVFRKGPRRFKAPAFDDLFAEEQEKNRRPTRPFQSVYYPPQPAQQPQKASGKAFQTSSYAASQGQGQFQGQFQGQVIPLQQGLYHPNQQQQQQNKHMPGMRRHKKAKTIPAPELASFETTQESTRSDGPKRDDRRSEMRERPRRNGPGRSRREKDIKKMEIDVDAFVVTAPGEDTGPKLDYEMPRPDPPRVLSFQAAPMPSQIPPRPEMQVSMFAFPSSNIQPSSIEVNTFESIRTKPRRKYHK